MMFSKFKISKTQHILYRKGPKQFENDQSVVMILNHLLLEEFDKRISAFECRKIHFEKNLCNSGATESAIKKNQQARAECFQLREQIRLLQG